MLLMPKPLRQPAKAEGRDEFSPRIFLIKVNLGLYLRRRKGRGIIDDGTIRNRR